ncbi:hypothetical protein Z950_2965 [Sulfitobacter mediterraneus KCTC 32188]|nr:hypothetical protein Z950_2965 [Sulfitobacter mediterraneus KCTC 32188]
MSVRRIIDRLAAIFLKRSLRILSRMRGTSGCRCCGWWRFL